MPISNRLSNLFHRSSSSRASQNQQRAASATSLPGKKPIPEKEILSLDQALQYISAHADISDSFKQQLFMMDIHDRHQTREISSDTFNLLNEAADRAGDREEFGYSLPKLTFNNYESASEYIQSLAVNPHTFNTAVRLLLSHHIDSAFQDDTSHFLLKDSLLKLADGLEINNQQIPGISEKLHHLQSTLRQHNTSEYIPPFKDHMNNVIYAVQHRQSGTEDVNSTVANYFSGTVNLQEGVKLHEIFRERDKLETPDYLMNTARDMINSRGISLEQTCYELKIFNDDDIARLRSETTHTSDISDRGLASASYNLNMMLQAIRNKATGTETIGSTLNTFFSPDMEIPLDIARQLEDEIRVRDILPAPPEIIAQAEALVRNNQCSLEDACNELSIVHPYNIQYLQQRLGL